MPDDPPRQPLVTLKRRGHVSAASPASCARQVVDGLPPLTDEQREVLALIFGGNRRKQGG